MGGGSSSPAQAADNDHKNKTKLMCKAAIRGAESVRDKEEQFVEAFKAWDIDGNGYISAEELGNVLVSLGMKVSKPELKKLAGSIDWNGDGAIDYQELAAWLFMAPYMTKFFETAEAINKKALNEVLKHNMTTGKMEEIQAKTNREKQEKLTPLLEASYEFHDKNSSGTLEQDESVIFFSNYMERLIPYVVNSKGIYFMMLDRWDGPKSSPIDPSRFVDRLSQHAEVALAEWQRDVNNIRNAFRFVDTNGDGRLNKDEVLSKMVLGTKQSEEFLMKLRLMATPEEFLKIAEETCPPRAPTQHGKHAQAQKYSHEEFSVGDRVRLLSNGHDTVVTAVSNQGVTVQSGGPKKGRVQLPADQLWKL